MNRFALALFFSLFALISFADAAGKVIGQLGQTVESAPIYMGQTSRSKVYYRAKAFDKLIIRPGKSKTWMPVLMANGRIGYIAYSKVAQLPYLVSTGGAGAGPVTVSNPGSDPRAAVANYSLKYVGTPYKWGGNDIKNGIDCSGFVQQLYGAIGIDLPRTAAEQAQVGKKISRLEDLRPGDRLYFWDSKRGRIGHTGLYLGNGFFVHSSVNNHGVDTDDLREQKWRNMLVSARR